VHREAFQRLYCNTARLSLLVLQAHAILCSSVQHRISVVLCSIGLTIDVTGRTEPCSRRTLKEHVTYGYSCTHATVTLYEGRLISNAHSEISRKRDHVFKQTKVGSRVQYFSYKLTYLFFDIVALSFNTFFPT